MISSTQAPSVILPRSVLSDLFRRCASLGDAGIAALNEAGYRTGAEAVTMLGDSPSALPAAEFWTLLDELLRIAGLGSVAFKPGGGSSAAIAWRDSAEAATGSTGSAPGAARCHFAIGLLRGALSHAAGRAVEVAEVRCGAGTEPCWFLFGSAETIHRIQASERPGAGRREH